MDRTDFIIHHLDNYLLYIGAHMNIGIYRKDIMSHLSRLWIEQTEVARRICPGLYTVVLGGHETIIV